MKKVSISAAILLGILVIVVGYIFFRPRPVTNYPSQGTTVIAFGDSLVKGIGATKGNDFVSLLSQELNIHIVNAGVSGNTTTQGLKRLQKDVLSKDPKVVLLLLGGNDILQQIPEDTTFVNLQKIITEIHQSGAIVLLLGVRGGLFVDNYRKAFETLAQKNNVAYVPDVLEGIFGNKQLMYDEVHPNNDGYKIIAAKIAPVLQRLIN